MAAIVWSDVVALAPELCDFKKAGQDLILDRVNVALDVDVFGGEASVSLRIARVYLAAHEATVSGQGSEATTGPVSSESAGGLARTYSNNTPAEAGNFADSAYGRLYLSLIRNTGCARSVVLL